MVFATLWRLFNVSVSSMATTDTLSMITLASALIESFEVNCAVASLLLYDYVLCIGEEVEYLWAGPWSLSRILYLAIYEPRICIAVNPRLATNATTIYTLSLTFVVKPIFYLFNTLWVDIVLPVKLFVFTLPISTLCQSVITLRIWYLFSRNLVIKTFAVVLLIATTVASILLAAFQYDTMQFETLHLELSSSGALAWLYVPPLVIHSVLFALKVYRFLTSSVRMQTDSLLWGFVKEGMFMYLFALASLVFGVVGLTMVEPSQFSVRMVAGLTGPVVAAIVVSTCRAMLSIRSLAATAHVDPEWLLNHAELSRVNWRRGSVDGEIFVEAGEPAIPLHAKYPLTLA
ncbi:hypothetical protein HD554DRAFT_1284736 [Boletus coccyginus]|nr:hypothetical protein HD554DRAFT_1284736 [Boletus coccyginus]